MLISNDEIFAIPYLKDSSKVLVYVPLRAVVLLVSKKNADLIFSSNDSIVKGKLLNYLKRKELINIKEIAKKLTSEVPDLSISLTNGCNLACIYCHAHAGELKQKTTSKEKIDQILNYYFNKIDQEFQGAKLASLGFLGGGEPTTQPKLLLYAVTKAKKMSVIRNMSIKIGTATNGCFNQMIAEFIASEFSYISLSLDGPEQIQNYHRPCRNGKGSFQKVFKTAKYFQKRKFDFAFRSTVSTITIENYKSFIDFFSDQFPGINIGLEPLYPLGRGGHCEIAPTSEQFSEGLQRMMQYAKNKKTVIKDSTVAQHETIRPFYCGSVAAPNINVTPEGHIWACARESDQDLFNYGYFNFEDNSVHIDNSKLRKIQALNIFNIPECSDCACKYHCAGDCPDNRNAGLLTKCKSIKDTFVKALNDFYNFENTV